MVAPFLYRDSAAISAGRCHTSCTAVYHLFLPELRQQFMASLPPNISLVSTFVSPLGVDGFGLLVGFSLLL